MFCLFRQWENQNFELLFSLGNKICRVELLELTNIVDLLRECDQTNVSLPIFVVVQTMPSFQQIDLMRFKIMQLWWQMNLKKGLNQLDEDHFQTFSLSDDVSSLRERNEVWFDLLHLHYLSSIVITLKLQVCFSIKIFTLKISLIPAKVALR